MITHFYAIIRSKDSDAYDFAVMTGEEVLMHMKKYSKNYDKNDSAWKTAFPEMAKKTVLLKAAKYAELSTEVQSAVSLTEMSEIVTQRNAGIAATVAPEFNKENQDEITDIDHEEVKDNKLKKVKSQESKSKTSASAIKEVL